jgi:hypothetical protein
MDGKEVDGRRFQRLQRAPSLPETRVVMSPKKIRSRYRFISGLINFLPVLLGLGWVLLVSGCAHDDDSAADHSQHHHHAGNHGAGQAGGFDRSGASSSATPIPGL